MSKNFEKVKGFYKPGLCSKKIVHNPVNRYITTDKFQEIPGQIYKKKE